MMHTESDQKWMQEAMRCAQRPWQSPYPNPRVGCVVVKNEMAIATGWHQAAGAAHAERVALDRARQAGQDPKGATLYTTLEPCAHQGRTPPCVAAIIEAGIARVVVGMRDPHALVCGRGVEALRAAGVEVVEGVLEQELRSLNPGFISLHERGRPFVQVKMACSVDGKIALANGKSQWISCVHARDDVQTGRAQADVILTGVGTILADDPRLSLRPVGLEAGERPRWPLRMIMDGQLRTPSSARLFQEEGPLCFLHRQKDKDLSQLYYPKAGQAIEYVQHQGSLLEWMHILGQRGHQWIWGEMGPGLMTSLWQEGLIDAFLVYIAPIFLGDQACSPLAFALSDLSQAPVWHGDSVEQIGRCYRLSLRSPGWVS